jgi:hypothetical protein
MNRQDMTVARSSAAVRSANHAGDEYRQDIKDCRDVVTRHVGLDFIAHVTSGIWDFSVHSLPPESRSEPFEQASRQLSLIVARLDEVAGPLDSGPLIRVVVQGDNGALFHIVKVVGQNFFGITLDGTPDTVERVDRDLAEIANKAADRVGSPSLFWGGYHKRGDSLDMWLPGTTPPPEEHPARSDATAEQSAVTDEVKRRCSAMLDRNDVHFVGIYRGDRLVWRADLFTDSALAALFQRVTPASRRRGYDRLLRQVMSQASRILQLLALVRSGLLTRLVLDVARGAIYVLPLGDHEHFLVGVTLLQPQVDAADKKMMKLHHELTETAFRPSGALPGPLAERSPAVARTGRLDSGHVDSVP